MFKQIYLFLNLFMWINFFKFIFYIYFFNLILFNFSKFLEINLTENFSNYLNYLIKFILIFLI